MDCISPNKSFALPYLGKQVIIQLPRRNITSGLVFALLLVASLSPVLLTSIPAMVDYPDHLARMFILANRGPGANPYYEVRWALYPNLAIDLLVPQLARVIGDVALATRLFLLFSQLLVISGALAIERAVKGSFQISGFVAVMFLYCLPFAWGFLNFEFGIGLACWGIALYLLIQECRWPARMIVNALFVVALFGAHFFALGVYGATLALYELWRASDRKLTYRETTLRLAVLALPALAMLGAMVLTGGSIGRKGMAFWFAAKWFWPFSLFNGYSLATSLASCSALIFWTYVSVRYRVLRLLPPGVWIVTGFLALYLLLPKRLFGTEFVDLRIIAAAVFIVPAFCTLSFAKAGWARLTVVGLTAVTIANLAVVLSVWLSYRGEYAAMIESFRNIENGAKVLIGRTDGDPPWRDLSGFPIHHAPTLAVYYRNAFVPHLYTTEGKQPVRAHPPLQRLFFEGSGPVPLATLVRLAEMPLADAPAAGPAFIRSWYTDYDYLYVVGPRVANPLPALLEQLDSSSRFVLYKIHYAP